MRNFLKGFLLTVLVTSCGVKVEGDSSSRLLVKPGTELLHTRPVEGCFNPRARIPGTRCSFYRECLEASLPCEDTAFPYALSYGEKYCNKFEDLRSSMSEKGKGWLDNTLFCLQESIAFTDGTMNSYNYWGVNAPDGTPFSSDLKPITCEQVRNAEFGIHPICYLGGPSRLSKTVHDSVCTLNLADTANVFRAVDAKDVMTMEAAVQMVAVAKQCILDINNKIGGMFGRSFTMLAFNMVSDENQQLLDLWTQKEAEWTAIANAPTPQPPTPSPVVITPPVDPLIDTPIGIFLPRYYADRYDDLKRAFGYNMPKLHHHYMTDGRFEGRSPSPAFDPKYYLNQYPDLQRAFGVDMDKALGHWIKYGIRECRSGSAAYNPRSYMDRYPDLQRVFGGDCNAAHAHFLHDGYREGRDAS